MRRDLWILVLTCLVSVLAGAGRGQSAVGDSVVKEPWVDVRAYASFPAAVTGLGATNTTLVVANAQTLTTNLTIPPNISLVILKGGMITGEGTNCALAINGPFQAGLYQVFAGSAVVTFGAGTVMEVYPEWWYAGSGSWHMAFQKAVNSTSVRVQLAGRAYDLTDEVVFNHKGSMQMMGQPGTVLYFDPTDDGVDGKVLLNCTRYQQPIYGPVFKNFSITVHGSNKKKIAIRITDACGGTIENIGIINWMGNGSIGLQLRGRHMLTVGKITISADRPVVVEQDAGLWEYDLTGLEYCRFYDTYLVARDPNRNVFDVESNMQACIIDGFNAWSGGMNGFYYPAAFPGNDFKLSNIWWDSPGPLSGNGGYFIYVREMNNQPSLKIALENLHTGGPANGYLISGAAKLSVNDCDYLGGGTGISLESCNFATLNNNDIRGTLFVTGMQEMLKVADPASTGLPHFVIYQKKGAIQYKTPRWAAERFKE